MLKIVEELWLEYLRLFKLIFDFFLMYIFRDSGFFCFINMVLFFVVVGRGMILWFEVDLRLYVGSVSFLEFIENIYSRNISGEVVVFIVMIGLW